MFFLRCDDINECDEFNKGGCDQAKGGCRNTLGSFDCFCNDGYSLDLLHQRLKIKIKISNSNLKFSDIVMMLMNVQKTMADVRRNVLTLTGLTNAAVRWGTLWNQTEKLVPTSMNAAAIVLILK